MNVYLRTRLADLQECLGPLFYRASVPGGLLTIWPTDAGWTAIGIPDREHPKGELRTVPVDGSNHRFRFRFHYPVRGVLQPPADEPSGPRPDFCAGELKLRGSDAA